jgi:hypothetical protein
LPWDAIKDADDGELAAWAIAFGTAEGGEFDYATGTWRPAT